MKNNVETKQFGYYSEEAGRYPLLSAEEERELSARIRGGDKDALNKLVAHNLRLVLHAAGSYAGVVRHSAGISLQDLIQEGNMGLMRAAEKFDGQRGVRFATFAMHHIRQRIYMAMLNHGADVHLPTHVAAALRRKEKIVEELSQRYHRQPTDAEVAAAMDIPAKKLRRLQQYSTEFNFTDGQVGKDKEFDLIEAAPDTQTPTVEDETEQKILRDSLMASVAGILDKAERQIVFDRIGYNDESAPKTLDELGNEFGISRERIRQKEERALEKLRGVDFDKLGFNVSVAETTK